MDSDRLNIHKYLETKRLIQQAKNEKQLVLFIGSGTSIDSGMPQWKEAVDQIRERLDSPDDSGLDYSIIPQYYYNKRGKKEYTQLIREIFKFNQKLAPMPIHERIMEFDVDTIITTNYDSLIEQAAENQGLFLQVISQDKDLAYRKAGKELIKIHGDFEHDNFVLKEDDYLHYHKNFKLIENYIKSIIGTKTVLFLGYSLSDPDVKHIFVWVKEILSDEFQNAYMIEVNKNYDINESEYYKNLGVNLIYASELISDFDKEKRSENLLTVVDYLLNNTGLERGYLEDLLHRINPYRSLNYILNRYIRRVFDRQKYPMVSFPRNDINFSSKDCNDDSAAVLFVEGIVDYFSGEKKSAEIEEIVQFISKSNIQQVLFDSDNRDCFDIDFLRPNEPIFDYFLHLNIKKIKEERDRNLTFLSEHNPDLYMQQSYINCFLHDYIPAYYCVSSAATVYYHNKNYVWYFIAMCNKARIGRIVVNDFIYKFGKNKEIIAEIEKEIEKIDLNTIFASLPGFDYEQYRFLKELMELDFSSITFYDAFADHIKSKEEAQTTYSIFTGLPAFEHQSNNVWDYYQYCLYNYIFIQRYREDSNIYDLYARTLLNSLCAPDKEITGIENDEELSNIHAKELRFEDIHLLIRFIKASELKKMFDENGAGLLALTNKASDYIIELADNLQEVLLDPLWNGNSNFFWAYLVIITHTIITPELGLKVFKALISAGSYRVFDYRKYIVMFVNALYKQQLYKNANICKEIISAISSIIGDVSTKPESVDSYMQLVKLLRMICLEGKKTFSDYNSVKKILSKKYYSILIEIYPICSKKVKTTILNELKKWHCTYSYQDFVLYTQMVIKEIIKVDENTEKMAFMFIKKEIEQEREQKKSGIIIRGSSIIEDYLELFLNHKIKDRDGFIDLINEADNEFRKWIINLNHYDYSKMNLNWLLYCNLPLLKEVARNNTARRNILKIFKEQYERSQIDIKITDIIINYFMIQENDKSGKRTSKTNNS